ncbi:40S ribosomal protein S2 [Hibiscus syriacus]|uniref:Small ribosomal subunit protein uS5 n=1 Tax=Hibiscus syriacus TaxID=106335 RepID=A0A6A3AM74_HIBSY|nr:40S ribosomal protein S2 [Hibiscus syriacus]
MAERGGGELGAFRRGFGGRSDRCKRGRRRGRRDEEEKWVPVTKLGRLLVGPSLKDEVMKTSPVQKQTRAGQRTRFKAFVVVGDGNGHVGLGVKCSKEVATAIRGAIILAKLSVIPVRRGYWGNKIGKPHTVPCKVIGKCGSVTVRMMPAPRGAGIVAARVPKKVLQFAGIEDVFTSSRGSTKTLACRGVIVAKVTGSDQGEKGNLEMKQESRNGRRDLGFAAAAAAIWSFANAAMGEEPKRGTPEAKKKYASVCVTMPTASICRK